MKWKTLQIPTDDPKAYKDAVRLNALGSLFFFNNYVLRKTRLAKLHWQMCQSVEKEDLHLVLEEPMGHFKTTIGIGLSMWWALPFTERDEFLMRSLGYDDGWIRWMKLAHNQNTRTLVTHEIEGRAIDMGKEVDEHYQQNDRFRYVFEDILPKNTATWNDHSKFQRRVKGAANIDATTGTFEYRGVGQALQGVHPDSTIQDDNMGRAAQESMLHGDGRVLEALIRWHRQLTTRLDTAAFDASSVGRQLVIGNRWGHSDLNSWIKANQLQFQFETHSAEGGCCKLHRAGEPIFPEEWSMKRLAGKRADIGTYDYAHFYLNQSILPEECIFKPEWLKYYRFKQSRPDLDLADLRNQLLIEHEVYNGQTVVDVPCGVLHRRMIVDLNHAKKKSRCEHVILVVGWNPEDDRLYILEVWAENAPYSTLVDKYYEIGHRWGMREAYLETVAAQNLMKFYLDERNAREQRPIYVNELPYDNSENAKRNRIEAEEPMFKNGQVWLHRSQTKFLAQYNSYPAGLLDILDTFGYVPQTLSVVRDKNAMKWFAGQQEAFASREAGPGGY
jgi:hypothetical protein